MSLSSLLPPWRGKGSLIQSFNWSSFTGWLLRLLRWRKKHHLPTSQLFPDGHINQQKETCPLCKKPFSAQRKAWFSRSHFGFCSDSSDSTPRAAPIPLTLQERLHPAFAFACHGLGQPPAWRGWSQQSAPHPPSGSAKGTKQNPKCKLLGQRWKGLGALVWIFQIF